MDLKFRRHDSQFMASSTELLQHSSNNPSAKSKLLFISRLLLTSIVLLLALTFAYLFFSTHRSVSNMDSPNFEFSRPLSKLGKPVVILISSDGFRFGYQYKTDTPNIDELIRNGIEADLGLIPSFPTITFPNHYTIATGLYPAYHGIINNYFTDPVSGDRFTTANHDPKWWLGEPVWETVVKLGLKASVYFWPGSEVKKGAWDCPKAFCPPYNGSVTFEERVDTVLSYFDLPSGDIPSFIALYFSDPDAQGHEFGPDDPRITEAVARIDKMIGRLIGGLKQRDLFDDVHIILVADHGMVGTCDEKLIFLDDLAPWIQIPPQWVQSYSPLLAITPDSSVSAKDVVEEMNQGLASGNVTNGKYLKVYLKEDLPQRLHYADSYRIPPIIGLLEEGFTIEQTLSTRQQCGGAHGYDNKFFSMRAVFFAHGPRFPKGRKVASFANVEIYNLVTTILNISGAPNNGTESFPSSILLP